MAVARHAGYGEEQLSVVLDERQQVLAEVEGVAAEVVVGIDAHHGVEEPVGEGKRGGVRLERDGLPVGEPAFLEEAHVV